MIGGNAIERLALSLPTDAAARRLLRKGVEYAEIHNHAASASGTGRDRNGGRVRADTDPGLPPDGVGEHGGVFRGAPPKFQELK